MNQLLFHFLSLFPLINLTFNYFTNQLGADPIDTLIDETGLWSLRFLLLTLMITPLQVLTRWQLNPRRILGLYAFFYSCLHFLSYLWFEQNFEGIEIIKDILTRPPIAIGVLSFLLMLPLVITSHDRIKQYLGEYRWKRVHQLIYLVTLGGLAHFWWLVQAKANVQEPFLYTVIFILLLIFKFLPIKDQLTK